MRVHLCDRPFATVPAIFERNEFRRESQIVQTRRNCTIPYNFPLFNYPRLKEFEKIAFKSLLHNCSIKYLQKRKRLIFLYSLKILSSKVTYTFSKKNLRNEKLKISVFILNNSSKIHYYKTKTVEMSRITYFIIL